MTTAISPERTARPVRLGALAAAAGLKLHGPDLEVRGITHDSRRVEPGMLYVAIPGATVDGGRFIPDAISAGAVALCAVSPHEQVPTIVAEDPRGALALLSAEIHGRPDREITLVGLTGSLGKTSTALLAEAALSGDGEMVGVIGSLGIRLGRSVVETGMTTPEAPAIHAALRSMVDRGAPAAVMEVTSHSIRLQRVRGLEFAVGALTNIVPDEHLEFHPTPEHYIRTKVRFFDMIAPGAPLVVNVDDEVARRVSRDIGRPVVDVSSEGDANAHIAATLDGMDVEGSRFTLELRRTIRRLDGSDIGPLRLPLHLPLLGPQQVANAALAAALALIVGASPESIARGLSTTPPIRRRMQVLRVASPMILDDTVGNPESIRAVLATARLLEPRSLRVAYALRGTRGPVINARNARTLAEELPPDAMLVVTEADESAGPRDRVKPEERDAARTALAESGRAAHYEARLDAAIHRVLEGAGDGDLVLLLGAQGMDGGAQVVRDVFSSNGAR